MEFVSLTGEEGPCTIVLVRECEGDEVGWWVMASRLLAGMVSQLGVVRIYEGLKV
jgi:hypothetical protein